MKRIFLLVLFFGCFHLASHAQGVSFSYLIPKNGYLSAPISPFSVRGIGVGETVGAETGITLYNIPGLGMENLPFENEKPLTGPHFAMLVPAELFIRIPLKPMTIKLSGGGFIWRNFFQRINAGNMDRAFREYEEWDVLNSDFELSTNFGFGWLAGIELEYAVSRDLAITADVHYLSGSSKSALQGSYIGGNIGENLQTKNIDIPDAAIMLQGLELSFGVKF